MYGMPTLKETSGLPKTSFAHLCETDRKDNGWLLTPLIITSSSSRFCPLSNPREGRDLIHISVQFSCPCGFMSKCRTDFQN